MAFVKEAGVVVVIDRAVVARLMTITISEAIAPM